MKKTLRQTLTAVTVACAFAFAFFANISVPATISDLSQTAITFTSKAEAGWFKDLEKDLRKERKRESRQTRREVVRDIKKDIRDLRKEQRNIRRADGDTRFANKYLSDSQLRALRALKSLPVGREVGLECLTSEANAIRSMCRTLPEFSYVRPLYDNYKEKIGVVVFRRY